MESLVFHWQRQRWRRHEQLILPSCLLISGTVVLLCNIFLAIHPVKSNGITVYCMLALISFHRFSLRSGAQLQTKYSIQDTKRKINRYSHLKQF